MTLGNLKWLTVSVAAWAIDIASKGLAESALTVGGFVEVLPAFNLALGHNTGVSFGLFSGVGGWQRWPLVILTATIAGGLVVWLSRLPQAGATAMKAALALIIGGAFGNIADRVRNGAVTDFLQLHYGGWYWPTFNFADVAITGGAILLISAGTFSGRQGSRKAER